MIETELAHQRVISNQELNTFKDSHNSGITVQTGNGIIFALKQKAHDSSLNEQFHLLEEDDPQVILVKADNNPVTSSTIGSSPSNFPTSGTAGCRTTHVNQYRTPPRVVDQGFGAGVNPAGAGGGGGAAEFDEQDTCPAPKNTSPTKIIWNIQLHIKAKRTRKVN